MCITLAPHATKASEVQLNCMRIRVFGNVCEDLHVLKVSIVFKKNELSRNVFPLCGAERKKKQKQNYQGDCESQFYAYLSNVPRNFYCTYIISTSLCLQRLVSHCVILSYRLSFVSPQWWLLVDRNKQLPVLEYEPINFENELKAWDL